MVVAALAFLSVVVHCRALIVLVCTCCLAGRLPADRVSRNCCCVTVSTAHQVSPSVCMCVGEVGEVLTQLDHRGRLLCLTRVNQPGFQQPAIQGPRHAGGMHLGILHPYTPRAGRQWQRHGLRAGPLCRVTAKRPLLPVWPKLSPSPAQSNLARDGLNMQGRSPANLAYALLQESQSKLQGCGIDRDQTGRMAAIRSNWAHTGVRHHVHRCGMQVAGRLEARRAHSM